MDAVFMRRALEQAELAWISGEVPVGAVVVHEGKVIATGYNRPATETDPTAHAEIVAMRAAAQVLGNYRLTDCELYVTLEPCAMCAMASLHARFKRVVYGAPEPKFGAAGSVVDLFSNKQLNHHTALTQAVLADECADIVKRFFQAKREMQIPPTPLRQDALRTPDERFENLPDYAFAPNYFTDLPSLDGLRLHYLDEGGNGEPDQKIALMLHGNPGWSYLYRKIIPRYVTAGYRVIAPDLIGFGRSDKPKRTAAHSFEFHRNVLLDLVAWLDLSRITLVVQDWGGLLGLTLPYAEPARYDNLVVMNTLLATGDAPLPEGFVQWREWVRSKPQFAVSGLFKRSCKHLSEAEALAYDAPFADAGMRASLEAFPQMVPRDETSEGAAISREAARFWREDFSGKAVMIIGASDPVFTESMMRRFAEQIRGMQSVHVIAEAGHFVQEWHDEVSTLSLAALQN
jgi:tRNA(adenine34) deaminase